MRKSASLPPDLERIRTPALVLGVLGLLACVLGFLTAPRHQFFLSYLFAYTFWVGIPLGSLALLMLQHLTGGVWGLILRRILESGTRLIPLMAALFLPLAFGLGDLYAWTHDPHARGVGQSAFRERYLTAGFFVLRTAIYFAIWMGFVFFLNRWSREEDRTGDPRLGLRFRMLSAAGLLAYGVTVSLAAVDWVMSLSPEWYSTIYGLMFIAGQGVSTVAFTMTLVPVLSHREPLRGLATPENLQDLGNLLLTFVMLWAYVSFSQFLIIWSADLAEETPYYVYRTAGAWKWVMGFLFAFHFFIPFLLLLSRQVKRRVLLVASVAGGVLLMRLVDLHWVIMPGYSQGQRVLPVPGFRMHWLDLAAPIGIGGVWVWAFLRELERFPLLPMRDPRLREVGGHG